MLHFQQEGLPLLTQPALHIPQVLISVEWTSLQYKVCNEQGLCDSAWIYFTVIPIDSDKDGIPDYLETRTSDSDEDGVLDYLSLDSDGDGILDRIEALGNLDDPCNVVLADCDSDGTPDYKDPKNCTLIIRVPKGFSPNGDGANDLFIIPGLDEYPNNSITIFNRWGNKIFEAAPYENNWGGKSENGATVGEGCLTGRNILLFTRAIS